MGHLLSFTVTDEKGKHYLLKGSGYKNNAAAIEAWRKGDNPELGVFDSEKEATNASKQMSEESSHEHPVTERNLGPLSYKVRNMRYAMDEAYDTLLGPNGEKLDEFVLNFLPVGSTKITKTGKAVLNLIQGGGKPGSAEVLAKRGNLTDIKPIVESFTRNIRDIQLSKALQKKKVSIKTNPDAQEDWFLKAFYHYKDYATKYEGQIDPSVFQNLVVGIAKQLKIQPAKGMKLTFTNKFKGLSAAAATDAFYGTNDDVFNNDKVAVRAVARDFYNKTQSNRYVTTEALLNSYGDGKKLGKQMAIYSGIDALKDGKEFSSSLPVNNPTQLAIITESLVHALTDSDTFNTVHRSLFRKPEQQHDIGYWGSKRLVHSPDATELPAVPKSEYMSAETRNVMDGYLQHGNLLNETIKKTTFTTQPKKKENPVTPDVIKELVNSIRR